MCWIVYSQLYHEILNNFVPLIKTMEINNDIQLSDMLESYPSNMTPNFQTIISSKKEFAELASNPTERLLPGKGQLFNHQKYVQRYLRAYDDLVLFDQPGSGKSCTFFSFAEYSRKELDKSKINPASADEKAAHFKRVIILVKGPTQKTEIKNQLVCRCSDGHYESSIVKKAKSETVQKTNITIELKKAGYIITTYTSFAHRIEENYPNESDNDKLAEDYSDTIFWIDEAHNLLIDPSIITTHKEKQQTYFTIWRVLHLALRSKRVISTATPMINDENEIGSLMNLILPVNGIVPSRYDYRTAPPNDIRVLFPNLPFDHKTATPEQMAPYFRGQFPPEYNFATATIQDLEPFFRGRISYVRAANTGAIAEEQGIHQTDEYEIKGIKYQSQLVIYATAMSTHQSDGYLLAKKSIEGRDELFGAERQASNFVFPDGYWGNGITDEERASRREARRAKIAMKAVARQVSDVVRTEQAALPIGGLIPLAPRMDVIAEDMEVVNEEGEIIKTNTKELRAFRRFVNVRGDTFTATPEFIPYLDNIENIRYLSCKYGEIVRLVMNDPGNCFVYGEFVEGSGAIVFALCLEGMGFVRYNESSSMFVGVGGDKIKPVCSGNEQDASTRRVRPDILSAQQNGPLRYALLTRDTSDAKFKSMMDAMNSYENRHGDYIKVLISSRVGRDAINVNNVLQIHLVGAEWNDSALYQALSRGLRATSHQDLIKEEQDRISAEGGDPGTATINVKIYKHAAVALDNENSSIDLQMYRMSEYKDRRIKRMMRIMRQCAIGCQTHYNRNVRDSDIDGSPVCDYDVCKYKCVDPEPTEEDYSTYDVLYAGDLIADGIGEVVNIYRQRNALTLEEIENLLPHYRRKYIIMALERLITNKTQMVDRFGYTSYLREDMGAFYLDRSYPTGIPASYAMSYYTQGVIGIEQETLANIVVNLESGENREILVELENMDINDPQFNIRLDSISIEGQATILEEVIIRNLQGDNSEFNDAILNKFQRMVFEITEPLTEMNKIYEQVNERRPKRGRKKNPELKRRIRKINPTNIDENIIINDQHGETIFLHTLYSQVINQTGYATTARFNKGEGRTRLLKPSDLDNGWRDLNELELPVYNAFIQIEIAKRNRPFEDTGLYGFILPDKKFRIRDRLTESKGAVDDARKIKRGKVCQTWYRPDLIAVMYEIGVEQPGGIFPEFVEKNREFLVQQLLIKHINKPEQELMTWDIPKLVYFYRWHMATQIDRTIICNLIKTRMAQTGRLID